MHVVMAIGRRRTNAIVTDVYIEIEVACIQERIVLEDSGRREEEAEGRV